MPNLLNITFKSNCNLTANSTITITGLTRTHTNSTIINVSSSSSTHNASYAYTDRSSSIDDHVFQCAESLVRSGHGSRDDVINRKAAWDKETGSLVITIGAKGTNVASVYEISFMVMQPADNTDFPRTLYISGVVEAGDFDSPMYSTNMSQGLNEHMGIHLGTMPLFTKLPEVKEFIVSQHYPLPGLLNVFHVRLTFDLSLMHQTRITIAGMKGMQSPENVVCDWEGNRAQAFQPQCEYHRTQGHLVILTSAQVPNHQPSHTYAQARGAQCVESINASTSNASCSTCGAGTILPNSRLANVSANVTYRLNFTLVNPPLRAILPLRYVGETLIHDEYLVPLVPGAVSTSAGTILGVLQSPNSLTIVNASTCVDLGDATCEGRTQYPMGCSLGHKLHDCVVQSDEQVLPEVIGCLAECNQSSGVIGDNHMALRSACCGLKCLDSCWTRRLAVKPLDLHTTCISPVGGKLPVVNVSLWRMHPGGSGGVYLGASTSSDGDASVVVSVAGEIDFTEGIIINARVVPGAGEGCSVETPWLCINSLDLSPSAPYLNSSGASRPVDLQTGVAIFTDLALQNALPGPYQIIFFASNLDRAGFRGRVGHLQVPNFLATSSWPVGLLRIRHTVDLCQCPARWYMGFNASTKKGECFECPSKSTSAMYSSSRSQCTCLPGYVDHQNADFSVTELVNIMEIPYIKEMVYVHTLNCSNINECYDSFLNEPRHNCDVHAQCHDTEGSFLCLCVPGYYGNGTACSACPEATFQAEAGRDNCSACPANATSLPASTSITMCGCNPGQSIVLQAQGCVACEPGHFSLGGGNQGCIQCEQGKFSDLKGASACLSCPAHTTSALGSLAVADCLCVAGYSGESSSGCRSCDPGSYKASNGTTDCLLCAAGSYSDVQGPTSCTTCPPNSFSEPGSASMSACGCVSGFEGAYWACSACLPGKFKAVAGPALCAGCQEGTYSAEYGADACTSCPDNALSPASSTNISDCSCVTGYGQNGPLTLGPSCVPCPLGTYKGVNMLKCTLCAPGLYGPVEGLGECPKCGRGTYSSTPGQLECHQCGPGKYLDFTGASAEHECVLCGAGKYSMAVGAENDATCAPCGRGKFSTLIGSDGEDKCILCGAGFYSDQMGVDSSTACQACGAGKYNPTSGNTAASDCTPCGKGKYSETPVATDVSFCLPCAQGTYLDTTGSSACTECPQGTYSTTVSATDISYCLPCSSGKYQQGTGGSAPDDCQACEAGTFSLQLGATVSSTCISCPIGTYANESGTTTCQSCPPGHLGVSLGLTACEVCVAGKFQAAEGRSTCDNCAAGKYSAATASTVCTACVAGKYQAGTGGDDCEPCPGSEEGKTSSPQGSTDVSECACSPGYSPYVNGVRISLDDPDPCRACSPGTYKALVGAAACQTCSLYSSSENASAFCNCDAGFAGSDGIVDAACSSTLSRAPFCTVTAVLPEGDLSSMSLTIDVVETDFSSASEYITFIYAGREIIASNLLVLDGNDATLQSCSSFTRLLDAVDVPEDAIETAGSDRFLKIRLETTASVGGNTACSGKTLYAKVYVRFRCQACRQGHYKNARGPEECQACGTASYSKQFHGSTECILCPPLSSAPQGSFTSSNCTCNAGLVGPPCSECGPGFYKPSSTGSCTECPGCPIGKYRHDCIHGSAGVCLHCALGFFKPTLGSEPCVACPAGTFGLFTTAIVSTGTHECIPCPAGRYSTGGASPCTACAAGTFSSAFGASSSATCSVCAAGKYLATVGNDAETDCVLCARGTYSSAGASVCLDCVSGKYLDTEGNDSESDCILCGKGTYAGVAGADDDTVCMSCPKGKFSTMEGAVAESVCQECPAGTFNENAGASMCSPCRVGTYSGERGATSEAFCLNCTAGTYGAYEAQDSLADCLQCPPGTFSKVPGAAKYVCIDCPAGTWSEYPARGTDCIECDRGKYSTFAGRTTRSTCLVCGAGKYSTYRGSPSPANCLLCEAGKYSSDVWTTTCQDCLYAPVNRATSEPGSTSIVDCVCLKGYGTDTCEACLPGTYKDELGPASCTLCWSGSYSEVSASPYCTACPLGASSPQGSVSPDSCLCKPGFTGLGLGCTPCAPGTYKTLAGAHPCQICTPAEAGLSTLPGADSPDLCLCTIGSVLANGTCNACRAGKYFSIWNRNTACLDCPIGTESGGGAGSCTCSADQGLQGLHGFTQGVCADDRDGSPSCQLRLTVPPKSVYQISIDVTQTDFSSAAEFISEVTLLMLV